MENGSLRIQWRCRERKQERERERKNEWDRERERTSETEGEREREGETERKWKKENNSPKKSFKTFHSCVGEEFFYLSKTLIKNKNTFFSSSWKVGGASGVVEKFLSLVPLFFSLRSFLVEGNHSFFPTFGSQLKKVKTDSSKDLRCRKSRIRVKFGNLVPRELFTVAVSCRAATGTQPDPRSKTWAHRNARSI